MILIYPPIAKPTEPPAGLAKLSGALHLHGAAHSVIDANLEAQLWLLNNSNKNAHPTTNSSDTWTRRAVRNVQKNLDALRNRNTYASIDRYSRAVLDLNRALFASTAYIDGSVTLGIANYKHDTLSPLHSSDLIKAADRPEKNPFYAYFSTRLTNAVENTSPRTIGISLNYISQALSAFAMAGFLRKHYPSIKIIMGGGLVTSWLSTNACLNNKFAGLLDLLVSGPGEHALLEMLALNPRENQHIRPDYSGFPLEEYLSPGFILPYSASSGCWWAKCSFCPELAEGNPYRNIPADTVSKDLADISGLKNPSLIHLLDNSISPALINQLVEENPPAPWYGFARITPELGDDDYCRRLKHSGCTMIKLGLESGDQSVLDSMQKGIDLTTASKALKALKKAGIKTFIYLLFGTPPESEREARRTLEFVVTHAGEIGFLNLAIFNLPRNAPEAATLSERKSFSDDDLSLYHDFQHPLGWDRISVRQFLDREFKKHPAIAPILKRTPPVFTSNHAAFF